MCFDSVEAKFLVKELLSTVTHLKEDDDVVIDSIRQDLSFFDYLAVLKVFHQLLDENKNELTELMCSREMEHCLIVLAVSKKNQYLIDCSTMF